MTHYTSTNPNFPLSVDLGPKFKPDPPKQPKGGWKLVRAAGIGLICGVVACIVFEKGRAFLPVFLVVSLVGWIGGEK